MYKHVRWAGGGVPRKFGDEHFLVTGASGSGKSTLIGHIMQSVLPDPSVRAIVYDPKQELVPFLFGLRGIRGTAGVAQSSVVLLHPFDRRGSAWDMAADIDSLISARQLATILVPDSDGGKSESFFTDSVRDVLTGVLMAFIECAPNAGSWRFRDVLLAMLYEPYLRFLLGRTETRRKSSLPMLQRLWETYFGPNADARTRSNIRASINAKLAIYEPIAAAWHAAEQAPAFGGLFSLKAWLAQRPNAGGPGSILVLGNDEAARAALDPINQALFKRATELVLARPERTSQERESGENQVWFFLDEVREAGRLDGLGRLLTKGRSKNACVVMGFQDIDGLREVYGKEMANEIVAQFNNVAVLRVNSPETAQWGSDLFGRRIEYSQNRSTTISKGEVGLSMNQGRSEEERPFFHTESFLYGPTAASAKAVVGKRRGPDIDTKDLSREEVQLRCSFTEATQVPRPDKAQLASLLRQAHPSASPKDAEDYVSEHFPRDPSEQILTEWTEADFRRLGFNEPPPSLVADRPTPKKGRKIDIDDCLPPTGP